MSHSIFHRLLAILSFTASALVQAAPPMNADLPDLVEKVLPGVVNISSTTITKYKVYGMDEFMRFWGIPQERRQSSMGSGFLIDKDGFIITNDHVVEGASEVIVTLYDKREFVAKIIGKDQKMDLALLQIRDKDRKVPSGLLPVPLGNSNDTRIAESVFAVGNPFGLQHTVTVGIVSAKNRTIGQGPFDNFLQTDASINPGNSGGPLFNLKGQVVGINTMIYSRTGQSGGVGFAIPINEAVQLIPDLKRYGRVPRPWLGILSERMTRAIQSYYGLPIDKGVLIYNRVEDAPAERAGIQPGDIITAVDGTSVSEPNDVERILAKRKPNEAVTLKVQRGRRSLDLKLRLEEMPRLERMPEGII